MNASLFTGRELRDAGIAKATRDTTVQRLIDAARDWAASYAAKHGHVSINDVRRVLDLSVIPPNAIGAIFRDRRFVMVGTTEAAHAEAHARLVRIYQLRGDKE
ncbi:MAG: hypothetical protein ACK53W_00025 [Gemmatimonadota bacterium]|jgi:hypothetical protein